MRDLKEITLPRSKAIVKIVTYYTRQEASAIQKVKWEFARFEPNENGEPTLQEMKGSYIVEQQNVELCQGVKYIKYPDGTVKEGESLSNEEILSLPDSDASLILKELTPAWSDPEADAKEKKSQSKVSQDK